MLTASQNTIHCRELTILVNCFSITNQSRNDIDRWTKSDAQINTDF